MKDSRLWAVLIRELTDSVEALLDSSTNPAELVTRLHEVVEVNSKIAQAHPDEVEAKVKSISAVVSAGCSAYVKAWLVREMDQSKFLYQYLEALRNLPGLNEGKN